MFSTMRASKVADEVVVSLPLSCPGIDENDKANLPRSYKFLNKEAAGTAFERYSSGAGIYVGDQCQNPRCLVNEDKDRFLEVLLMVFSFLLSFSTAGAFYFTQALTIVGSHDPVLKQSLASLNTVFAASFFCNFLGLLVSLVLQSRAKYHPYKKFSLIISNAASFLFMVLGYGILIAFNIQRG